MSAFNSSSAVGAGWYSTIRWLVPAQSQWSLMKTAAREPGPFKRKSDGDILPVLLGTRATTRAEFPAITIRFIFGTTQVRGTHQLALVLLLLARVLPTLPALTRGLRAMLAM